MKKENAKLRKILEDDNGLSQIIEEIVTEIKETDITPKKKQHHHPHEKRSHRHRPRRKRCESTQLIERETNTLQMDVFPRTLLERRKEIPS